MPLLFAGQYWLDMMSSVLENGGGKAEFVMPWSVHEGTTLGDGGTTDHGIIQGTVTDAYMPTSPTSTFYHYKMMAENFNCIGNYQAPAAVSSNNPATFKAFGGYTTNAKLVVVLMNQDLNTDIQCTLRLDNTASTGTYWVKMNFPGTISSPQQIVTVNHESTTVLVFGGGGELARKIVYQRSDGSNGVPVYSEYSESTVARAHLTQAWSCANPNALLTSTPNMNTGSTYSWYRSTGNEAFTQVTGSSYTLTVSTVGIYKVQVTKNGCTAVDYLNVQNPCTMSPPPRFAQAGNPIESPVSQLGESVPNPSTGKTALYYTLSDDISKAEIRITDIYGKTLDRIPIMKESTNVEFNCGNCASGVYFYTLIIDGTNIDAKKMVIAK